MTLPLPRGSQTTGHMLLVGLGLICFMSQQLLCMCGLNIELTASCRAASLNSVLLAN